ncbi:MAG: hypothetical protein GY810_10430 [Aureispira sp.]|nr:hypothetical protein [Aureispira sp.]
MAIKNKVKPVQYTEDAAKSITADKMKAESHSAVKMLIKKGYNVKTSFFLKAGHFKGDKIKFKGMFLAIGDSPALLKKFKQEKTDPSVAYGNLFVKQEKGEDIVHFEYVSGQGKLKKPADWKALFKEIKKMIKKKCAFVIDGQAVKEDAPQVNESSKKEDTKDDKSTSQGDNTKEDLAAKLERKAKIAEDLLSEVEIIKSAYDREKKDKLYRKTTKWLANYDKISADKKTDALKSHFPKIQKAHSTVKEILATDNKITKGLDQVFGALEKFMQAPDHKAPNAQKLAQKIKTALGTVIPLIKKVKDTDLLKECEAIEEMLAQ